MPSPRSAHRGGPAPDGVGRQRPPALRDRRGPAHRAGRRRAGATGQLGTAGPGSGCGRRRGKRSAADRFPAGGVLPELALRRPRRTVGGRAGRLAAASALLGNRRHHSAGPGEPHRGGDATRGDGPGVDLQRRGAGHRAGGQEERCAPAVEPPQVLAVPVGAAAPLRDRPRGSAGLGDVPAVGHRPAGPARSVAGRRCRRGRGDDGRDERCRRGQSARLAAGRTRCRRGGNCHRRTIATSAGPTPSARWR